VIGRCSTWGRTAQTIPEVRVIGRCSTWGVNSVRAMDCPLGRMVMRCRGGMPGVRAITTALAAAVRASWRLAWVSGSRGPAEPSTFLSITSLISCRLISRSSLRTYTPDCRRFDHSGHDLARGGGVPLLQNWQLCVDGSSCPQSCRSGASGRFFRHRRLEKTDFSCLDGGKEDGGGGVSRCWCFLW